MISFQHSFSTRIFLDEKSSPERDARRALAAVAAKAEARTPNELREFWWFLRGGKTSGGPSSREVAGHGPSLAGARPSTPKHQAKGGNA